MLLSVVMPIYALNDQPLFPDPREAEADGLLAIGGDLSPQRVLTAYALGIFPWPIPAAPLAWFSPDPRMVLEPTEVRVSRSLRRSLRNGGFTVTFDEAFEDVIAGCSEAPRPGQQGTWITPAMIAAYTRLHRLGFAHSVEVRRDGALVGGLYGISLGRMFCGESMFHRVTDASKVAFVTLAAQLDEWDFAFLDCQLHTPHLASLGAHEIPRETFLSRLDDALQAATRRGAWTCAISPEDVANRRRSG